jgi:hypothetical protein
VRRERLRGKALVSSGVRRVMTPSPLRWFIDPRAASGSDGPTMLQPELRLVAVAIAGDDGSES